MLLLLEKLWWHPWVIRPSSAILITICPKAVWDLQQVFVDWRRKWRRSFLWVRKCDVRQSFFRWLRRVVPVVPPCLPLIGRVEGRLWVGWVVPVVVLISALVFQVLPWISAISEQLEARAKNWLCKSMAFAMSGWRDANRWSYEARLGTLRITESLDNRSILGHSEVTPVLVYVRQLAHNSDRSLVVLFSFNQHAHSRANRPAKLGASEIDMWPCVCRVLAIRIMEKSYAISR